MISPKGKGRNILISNSVAEIYFPACLLANKNVHRLLNPGHLPNPALPKTPPQSSYERNFPEGLLCQ